MSTAKMGAVVQYCGHEGTFVADIHRIGNVNVVRASRPVTPGNLDRDPETFAEATHHLSDFPKMGFWRPDLGVFVVEEKQVTEVKKGRR